MQLWRKMFLLAYTLLSTILAVCLTIFICQSFYNDFQQMTSQVAIERNSILHTLENYYRLSANQSDIKAYCEEYKENHTFIAVQEDGRRVVDTEKRQWDGVKPNGGFQLRKYGNRKSLVSLVHFTSYQGKQISLTYSRDIHSLYQRQEKRLHESLLLFIVCDAVILVIFYLSMRKIYRPVENIAHELKTPLTTIQGYSEYLIRARLDEGEQFFVAEQIMNESIQLKEIIEKLLIIGSLRDEPIDFDEVALEEILAEFKQTYPNLEIQTSLPKIEGNEILIKSLFSNLLSNAFRGSNRVWIAADGQSVQVGNTGKPISQAVLKKLNHHRSLKKGDFSGTGKGVALCHDIMKLHHGTLTYTSDEQNGTIATLKFGSKKDNT